MSWFSGHKACGILALGPGDWTRAPCIGRWSLHPWTAREVPKRIDFILESSFSISWPVRGTLLSQLPARGQTGSLSCCEERVWTVHVNVNLKGDGQNQCESNTAVLLWVGTPEGTQRNTLRSWWCLASALPWPQHHREQTQGWYMLYCAGQCPPALERNKCGI